MPLPQILVIGRNGQETDTTAEYPTPARRPAWSVLSCEKLERTFGLRLPGWVDMPDLALGR